ncbi:hypothetical protein BH10PSE11_BH10PSE11_10120 [soil metagenome]
MRVRPVMAGLNPAIHAFLQHRKQDVDHRAKPGDDDRGCGSRCVNFLLVTRTTTELNKDYFARFSTFALIFPKPTAASASIAAICSSFGGFLRAGLRKVRVNFVPPSMSSQVY